MALSFDQLKDMMNKEGLQYFVHASEPSIMFAAGGANGSYQFVMSLAHDGQFFQLRTLNYLHCPAEHRSLPAVLQALASVNYDKRLLKFGWGGNTGEVVAYADAWLMDGTLTQAQLNRILANYASVVDLSFPRLRAALETGKDANEPAPAAPPVATAGPGGLPSALQKLLDRLAGGEKKKEAKKDSIDEI